MTEETFSGRADAWRDDFTEKNQGDAQRNPRNCRRDAYVGRLAKPARRFILPIRVPVRRYLEEKQEGEKCQGARQRLYELPSGFLREQLHPCPPAKFNSFPPIPGKGPKTHLYHS